MIPIDNQFYGTMPCTKAPLPPPLQKKEEKNRKKKDI